jgi:hypothetical protein
MYKHVLIFEHWCYRYSPFTDSLLLGVYRLSSSKIWWLRSLMCVLIPTIDNKLSHIALNEACTRFSIMFSLSEKSWSKKYSAGVRQAYLDANYIDPSIAYRTGGQSPQILVLWGRHQRTTFEGTSIIWSHVSFLRDAISSGRSRRFRELQTLGYSAPYRRCNAIWPHQINSFLLLPLPYSPLILYFNYADNYFAAFSIILQRSFVRVSPHLWPNIITLAPIQISYWTNHVPRVAFIDGGALNLQILRVRIS